jgi:abhydrolase domain-containing protein 17
MRAEPGYDAAMPELTSLELRVTNAVIPIGKAFDTVRPPRLLVMVKGYLGSDIQPHGLCGVSLGASIAEHDRDDHHAVPLGVGSSKGFRTRVDAFRIKRFAEARAGRSRTGWTARRRSSASRPCRHSARARRRSSRTCSTSGRGSGGSEVEGASRSTPSRNKGAIAVVAMPPMEEKTKRLLLRLFVGELSWKRLASSVAFVYGSLAAFAYLGSDRILFQPHAASYAAGGDVIMLDAGAGVRIAARHLESPGARFTILVSHGNAEDLGDLAPLLEQLRALGASVLAYDYEGYGLSGGAPSEARLYADVDAAYRYLTVERGVAPENVIAYGRSLGGGPSVDLASRMPLGGLVLESAFTSVFRVVTRVPIFPGDKLVNLPKMDRVRCPVLVLHERRDPVIPFHHGEALFAAAPGPKLRLWVDEEGHADVANVAGAEYDRSLRELLRLASEARPTR